VTEEQWNACTDPRALLDVLAHKARPGQRRRRLLLCACCRHLWHLFQANPNGRAIEVAELQVDGLVGGKEVRRARRAVDEQLQQGMGWREEDVGFLLERFEGFHFEDDASWVAAMTATFAASRALSESLSFGETRHTLDLLAEVLPESRKDNQRQKYRHWQCGLIRELFGNPFRPLPPLLKWNGSTVVNLARAAYDDREMPEGTLDSTCLAVLADALEEVGAGLEFLDHLRGPDKHYRGCHVVDAILGKV
jgi:hypothetical protein